MTNKAAVTAIPSLDLTAISASGTLCLPKFVRWIPFTSADYWVLKLDPDYQRFVGTPDRKYLWLLARDANLAQHARQEYLAEAER